MFLCHEERNLKGGGAEEESGPEGSKRESVRTWRSSNYRQDGIVFQMESSCTVILWMEIGRRGVSLGDKAFTSIKGTASLKHITEEVIRFTLENGSRDACILQADSERATRQILRAAQQEKGYEP